MERIGNVLQPRKPSRDEIATGSYQFLETAIYAARRYAHNGLTYYVERDRDKWGIYPVDGPYTDAIVYANGRVRLVHDD